MVAAVALMAVVLPGCLFSPSADSQRITLRVWNQDWETHEFDLQLMIKGVVVNRTVVEMGHGYTGKGLPPGHGLLRVVIDGGRETKETAVEPGNRLNVIYNATSGLTLQFVRGWAV